MPAVVLLAVLAQSSGNTPAADEWPDLDREIDALSTSPSQERSGPQISGWLRARYATSSDIDLDTDASGNQDLGGFNLDSVRLNIGGAAGGGYSYWLSLEAGNQALLDTGSARSVALYDAYATVPLGEHAQVIMGRFSSNFLWSTNIEERNLLFLDRTLAGENTDNRDLGVEFSGAVDRFNWWAAVQNGSDGVADEVALSGRASYRVFGEPFSMQEGGCDPTADATQLVVGAGYFDDPNLDEGTALGADVWFFHLPFSAYAEVVDWDDGIRPLPAIDPISGTLVPSGAGAAGCETSTSLTLGYVLSPSRWEIAARWQDLDDSADTSVLSAALDRYIAGHDTKWTLQLDTSSSDDPALEAVTIALGLTIGL